MIISMFGLRDSHIFTLHGGLNPQGSRKLSYLSQGFAFDKRAAGLIL